MDLGIPMLQCDDDHGLVPPPETILPRKQRVQMYFEGNRPESEIFFRCLRNPFKHMTLQGSAPQDFDVLLHPYLPMSDASDGSAIELLDIEEEVACNLLDVAADVLINEISLWRLSSVKVCLRTGSQDLTGLPQESSELLLEMATAGAFEMNSSSGPTAFFFPGPDSIVKKLLSKGLVEKHGAAEERTFWITEAGASLLLAVQVAGPKQTMSDYQKILGLAFPSVADRDTDCQLSSVTFYHCRAGPNLVINLPAWQVATSQELLGNSEVAEKVKES